MPNTPNDQMPLVMAPPVNCLARKSDRSIIGSADRLSTSTNAVADSSVTAPAARISGEVQPAAVALDERVGQGEQREGGGDQARQVEAAPYPGESGPDRPQREPEVTAPMGTLIR